MICSWVAEMRHALDKPLHSGAVCEQRHLRTHIRGVAPSSAGGHLRSWSRWSCFSSRLMGDAGCKGPALRQRFSAPHQLAATSIQTAGRTTSASFPIPPASPALQQCVAWSLLGSAFQGMHNPMCPHCTTLPYMHMFNTNYSFAQAQFHKNLTFLKPAQITAFKILSQFKTYWTQAFSPSRRWI